MRGRYPTVLLALVLLLVLAVSPAAAQTIHGSISGTILDSTGAVIPGAKIVIRNLETGQVRETLTNESGFFRVPALPVGNYSVSATATNFETVLRAPIAVETAVDRSIELTLKPAPTAAVVTITEEAPLVESTQSQLSKGVEARRINELPLAGSTLNALALLQPGALPNNNGRPGSGFAVNGGRTRSNMFTIDGANNNDQSLSTPRQSLPTEAIQQFRIITNNYQAEYGRNSGSYVNQITKSGSNDFHGIVRWGWLGNGLDALTTAQQRTYSSQRNLGRTDMQALRTARGVTVRNVGLGSVGGPIKKDHTFFFTSYDREWFRTTAVASTDAISPAGVATLEANAGKWSAGALDFLKKTFPTANEPTNRGSISVCPSTTLSDCSGSSPKVAPLSIPIQRFNRALTGALPYGWDYYRWLMKADSRVLKGNLSFRYLIDDNADPGNPSAIPGNEVGSMGRNQSATLNHVLVIRPTMVNEARITYARRSYSFPESLPPNFTITGFNSVGNQNYPQFRTDNLYEYTDNISVIRGSHTLKTGGNFLRYQLNSFFAPNSRGLVTYGSLRDFLLDLNASFSQYAGTGMLPARTSEFSGFFQDSWRASQSVTLNLGLRYEYTGAPFGYFSNAKPDANNWAPRFGFAYAPRGLGWLGGNGKLSIRGGWSLAYDQVFQNILLNNARNYPRGVSVAITNISGSKLYEVGNRPAPPTPEQYKGDPKLLPVRLYSPDKRISQPYSQQYSLGIERQFAGDYVFKVFYVGSRAVRLVREVETNVGFQKAAVDASPATYAGIIGSLKPVANAAGTVTGYRVDPTKGSILVGDGLAQSTYHSLQTTVEKRYSNGMQFEFNYTYSSFINDSDDILGGQTNNTLPAVPFNFKLDRGRSGFDQPHRAVINYVYELPVFRNQQGILGRVLGGWQVSGIMSLASGIPYTILNSNNALGIFAGQISTVEGSQRPSYNPSGTANTATSSTVTSPMYIANGANSGIIGTLGRNTMRVGTTANWDAALMKRIRLFGEHHAIDMRWEVYNALNYRNFTTIPARNASNSTNNFTFLNLGQTDVGGRGMIFTLRYNF